MLEDTTLGILENDFCNKLIREIDSPLAHLIIEIFLQLSISDNKDLAFALVEKQKDLNNLSITEIIFDRVKSIGFKEQFYLLLGNLANEGVYVRDSIFKIEGLVDLMIDDIALEDA